MKKRYIKPQLTKFGSILEIVQAYSGTGGDYVGRQRPTE